MGGEDGLNGTNVSSSESWESSFVAVGAVLGESLEDLAGMIGDAGVMRAQDTVRGLRQKSRASRAMALATAIAVVARALEEGQLA